MPLKYLKKTGKLNLSDGSEKRTWSFISQQFSEIVRKQDSSLWYKNTLVKQTCKLCDIWAGQSLHRKPNLRHLKPTCRWRAVIQVPSTEWDLLQPIGGRDQEKQVLMLWRWRLLWFGHYCDQKEVWTKLKQNDSHTQRSCCGIYCTTEMSCIHYCYYMIIITIIADY